MHRMCNTEIRAVRRAYPQIRTWLGAALILIHTKWCRPRFVLPVALLTYACWVVVLITEWQRAHP